MKDNDFTLKKARSKRYSVKTIMDADYTHDIVVLSNTPTQAESLLHSLEQPCECRQNRVHVFLIKKGDITTLNGGSLKLVDKFSYPGSRVSSIENDINKHLAKVWTATDRLSFIWKSDLSDKIKHSFFYAAVVSILLYGYNHCMYITTL